MNSIFNEKNFICSFAVFNNSWHQIKTRSMGEKPAKIKLKTHGSKDIKKV